MTPNNKYHNSKIYKIVNDITDDIYIGSTCQVLSNRMAGHRSHANGNKYQSLVYRFMRETGINHFTIILIENYKCENKEELTAREHYHIKEMKPSLNTFGAILDLEKRQQSQKAYAIKNRDAILEKKQEYRQNHLEEEKERGKKWVEAHRKQSNDIKLRWAKEKITCPSCQLALSQGSLSRHKKKMHS